MVGVTGSIPVAPTIQSGYQTLCGDLRIWPAIGALFLLSACGLSVPVGALACIEAPVSAAKNFRSWRGGPSSLKSGSMRTFRQQLMRLQRRSGVVIR